MTLSNVLSSSSRIIPSEMVSITEHCISINGRLTSFLRVGELDEDRMFLHDALDVLSTNTNDSFVILIGHMERDRGWHLLLYQAQALLHRLIGRSVDVNVEVVFAKVFEHDLNVA